jgi:NAD+ synthase (glutamine-hydrolysing)
MLSPWRHVPLAMPGPGASADCSETATSVSVSCESQASVSARLMRPVERHPFVPVNPAVRETRCREILAIQTAGLAKRLVHTGIKRLVVAVSGGLDSTLALLVATRTMDRLGLPRSHVLGITMPGFGTTDRTHGNALSLMRSLGTEIREIPIAEASLLHFRDIGHDPAVHDVTYENVQARERTQIAMDIANGVGALLVGTGDLSELALGWCTYNGDHMSMYAVNTGVPKTLVKYVVGWYADHEADHASATVLRDILDTPISPELLPPDAEGKIAQKTEEVVGPYELHDFFLYHVVRYGAPPDKVLALASSAFAGVREPEEIRRWLRVFLKRFFSQQFKRSCLPDGPKVGTISLSPRADWRMPSDASVEEWLRAMDGSEQANRSEKE